MFYLQPCVADDLPPAVDFGFARTQRHPQRNREADHKVHHSDEQHEEHALQENQNADAARHGGIAHVGGRKRDVADVERQIQCVADEAGHAQQHAEAQVAHQCAVVIVPIVGQLAAQGLRQQHFQYGVVAQAHPQVQVVAAVVEIARNNPRAKQPHAGNGGIPQGGFQGVDGIKLRPDFGFVEQGESVGGVIDQRNYHGHADGHQYVACHGGNLRAQHVHQQLCELLLHHRAFVGFFHGGGKARSGHCRLLGRHGKAEHENQHEAQAVIQAGNQAV